MREFTDLYYMNDGNPMHMADIFLPDAENFDTVIYVHGGGLEAGSRKHVPALGYFIQKGFAVASVEYSLLPQAKFPGFIYETASAVRFIKSFVLSHGGSGNVFLWGQSAGAYITMMLCLDKKYFESVSLPNDTITGFISDSSQQLAHFNLLKSRGFDSRLERIDETAPIYYVYDGMEIQPLLILCYSDDMPCRPEENMLMYKYIKRFTGDDFPLEFACIPGKHCRPDNPAELYDTVSGFIGKIKTK